MQLERRYIHVIEGARGFAAFYILFHHVVMLADSANFFSQNLLLKTIYDFSSSLTNHILMMFFLLSGFSIHYANKGRIDTLSWPKIRTYLYKRLRRIYPIYALAVVLSLAAIELLQGTVGPNKDWAWPTTMEVVGAFVFFSDLPSRDGTWISTLSTNGPLWSLSYEVLYYLLYPLFSVAACRYGIERAIVLGAVISLGAYGFATAIAPIQPSNMFSLYILWCLGAYLAEIMRRGHRYSLNAVAFYCIAIAWAQSAWIFESFLLWRIPLAVNLYIGLLIFFVMFAGLAEIQKSPWTSRQRAFCALFAVAVSAAAGLVAVSFQTTDNYEYLFIRLVLVMLAGIAWLLANPAAIVSWLRQFMYLWQSAGAYSYGLYILQFPMLIVIHVAVVETGASALWGMLAVVPVICLSRVVEVHVQPRMAKMMDALLLRQPVVGTKVSVSGE